MEYAIHLIIIRPYPHPYVHSEWYQIIIHTIINRRRILDRLAAIPNQTVIAGVRNVDKASKALSESSTVVRGAMVQKVPSLDAAGLELRKLDGMYISFV